MIIQPATFYMINRAGTSIPRSQKHIWLCIKIIEGFKKAPIFKIEISRSGLNLPFLFPHDPNIIALVTDDLNQSIDSLPLLDINDESSIAHYIQNFARNIPLQMTTQYSPLFLI